MFFFGKISGIKSQIILKMFYLDSKLKTSINLNDLTN